MTRLNRLKNSPRIVKLTRSLIVVRFCRVTDSSFRACVRTPGSAIGAVNSHTGFRDYLADDLLDYACVEHRGQFLFEPILVEGQLLVIEAE